MCLATARVYKGFRVDDGIVMDGLISPNAITVAARSGRRDQECHDGKRLALGPQRIGLPVFLSVHAYDEAYAKYALVDSDLRLFQNGTGHDLIFYGITAVTGDFTPDHAFQTIAVGGTVNTLNTGKWPIRQLDVIYAVYEKSILHKRYAPDGGSWLTQYHNKNIDFPEPCAVICASEYLSEFGGTGYVQIRLGIAMSTDRGAGGRTGTHSFSLLLDLPAKRP